jgi:hypothetical protein
LKRWTLSRSTQHLPFSDWSLKSYYFIMLFICSWFLDLDFNTVHFVNFININFDYLMIRISLWVKNNQPEDFRYEDCESIHFQSGGHKSIDFQCRGPMNW